MNYTLHKLPEGFIITSNKPEEGINTEVTYYDDKVDSNGLVTLPEMFTENLNTYLVKGIKENRRYVYKVISQQNQIDFSALSEDEQKYLGFQKSQELLSDRMFTLEDIEEAIRYGFDVGFCSNSSNKTKNNLKSKESFIQSLSQPKLYKVELEMDCTLVGLDLEDNCKPKLTNGKVKILKLL